MKLIDRYIFVSVAATFLFGVVMFMVLLMAVGPLQKLIEMVAEQGVPVGQALGIFLYRLPYSFVLTFPMSVLLSILLAFSRMSADSEMVAIRAAGVSFVRIVVPTLAFALLVTGATYYLVAQLVPLCSERAAILTAQALKNVRRNKVAMPITNKEGHLLYSFVAGNFDARSATMEDFNATVYDTVEGKDVPVAFFMADAAHWSEPAQCWEFTNLIAREVNPKGMGIWAFPSLDKESKITIGKYALKIKENPFVVSSAQKKPEDMRAEEIQQYIQAKAALGTGSQADERDLNKYRLDLARRSAVPFTCLVFALIAAPLGLRHHRTSSSVGLGISLLVIIVYYFALNYLNTLGESGAIPIWLAAWLPNIFGAGLGVGLIWRANR